MLLCKVIVCVALSPCDIQVRIRRASDKADRAELTLLHDRLEDDGLMVLGATHDGADVLALLDLVALLVVALGLTVARGDLRRRHDLR